MKLTIHRQLLCVIFLMLSLAAKSYDFSAVYEGNTFYFRIASDYCYLTYGDEQTPNQGIYSGVVRIPESVTYNGLTYGVNGIDESAFHNCKDMTGVVFPSSIVYIGANAFYGCTSLSLRPEDLPPHLQEVGIAPFAMSGVAEPLYKNGIFIYYPTSYSPEYQLPSDIEVIAQGAFSYCDVNKVTIPASVYSIAPYAFYNCNNLSEIEFKNAEPISANGLCFYGSRPASYPEECTLYVPAGSENAYKNASFWSSFGSIIPTEIPVAEIGPNRQSEPISIGETVYLTVWSNPADCTFHDDLLTWSSSDENVATVDGDGNVTGVKAGKARITATYDNEFTADFYVAVIPAEEDCDWWNILENGNADQDFDSNIKNVGDEGWENVCAWSEVNDAYPAPCDIEEVGGNRVFVVHSPALTIADYRDKTRSQFWINAPRTFGAGEVVRIKFRYKASRDCSISAEAQNKPGISNQWNFIYDINEINFTNDWQEFDKMYVVSEDQAGENGFQSIAFNLGVDIATVFYFDDLSWELVDIPVTDIYPIAETELITVGGTALLDVWSAPDYSTIHRDEITWTSDNESVATVDDNGRVTGVSAGKAKISATYSNGSTANFYVAVIPAEGDFAWRNILENGSASLNFDSELRIGDEGWRNVSAWSRIRLNTTVMPCAIETVDDNRVFAVHSPEVTDPEADEHGWENQFWINSPRDFEVGDVVRIKFRYKASRECEIPTQSHGDPEGYHIWYAIGAVNFTTKWQTFDYTFVVNEEQAGDNGLRSIAFNLGDAIEATDFYFDDIQLMVISENPWQKPVPAISEEDISMVNTPDGTTEFYLYNVGMQQFLYQGESWGTQATVADEGLPLRAFAKGQYRYFLTTPVKTNAKDYLFRADDGCYVDGAIAERGQNGYWKFNDLGDGTFTLTVPQAYYGDLLENIPGITYYFACNKNHQTDNGVWENDQRVTYGIYYDETALTDNARWKVVSVEAYEAYQANLAHYRTAERLRQAIEDAKAVGKDVTEAELVYSNPNSTIEKMEQAIANLNLYFASNGIWYRITNDDVEKTVAVAKQNNHNANSTSDIKGELTISSTVTYGTTPYTVKEIDEDAFRGCTGITSVDIAGSVEYIHDHAFCDCSNLSSVTLHEGLKALGHTVFAYASFTSITLPASIEWVDVAFAHCSNLAEIKVAEGSTKFTSIDGALYENLDNGNRQLKSYPHTKSVVQLPSNVESIFNLAFCGNKNIETLCVPKSVTKICGWGLAVMDNLKKLVIPQSVTDIDIYAVTGLPSLRSLYLYNPLSLKTEEELNYGKCSLYIPAGSMDDFTGSEYYENEFARFKEIVEVDPSLFEPNCLFAENVKVGAGSSAVIPVVLRNASDVEKVYFELGLPVDVSCESITLAEGIEGKIVYNSSTYSIEVTVLGCNIAPGEQIVANVTISVADTAVEGDYEVTLGNIAITPVEDEDEDEENPIGQDGITSIITVHNIVPGTDITDLLKNPTFDLDAAARPSYQEDGHEGFAGWNIPVDINDNLNTGQSESDANVCEAWSIVANSVHQTITDVPLGFYEMKTQAFQYEHPMLDPAQSYEDYKNNRELTHASVFVGKSSTVAPNIWSGLTKDLKSRDDDWCSRTIDGEKMYIPADKSTAKTWFDNGYYNVSAIGECTDGTLDVGFRQTYQHSWLVWTKVSSLRYLGQAYLYADDITVCPSQRFNLQLSMKNVIDVKSMTFDLTLPEGFTVEGAKVADRASSKGITYNPNNGKYTFSVTAINDALITGNDGVVATINICASDDIADGSQIKISEIVLADVNNKSVSAIDSYVKLTVGDVLYGDVNKDGKVDIADVTTLIDYVIHKNPQPFNYDAADVNSDGKVDIADVTTIIDFVIHKINSLPQTK